MKKTEDTIRASQLLFHYGPGAIADLKSGSFMPLGVNNWNLWSAKEETDPRVTSSLDIDHVKLLNYNTEKLKVRATRFPKWHICPSCGKMDNKGNKDCYSCSKKEKEAALYPSRFVVTCIKGHIHDFPYIEWAHGGAEHVCETPKLSFSKRGTSGSLSDLTVQCLGCKKSAVGLGTIMDAKELKKIMPHCKGERPWLEDTEKCSLPVQTYLRGSASLYSPAIVSFLQIPPTESSVSPVEDVAKELKKLVAGAPMDDSVLVVLLQNKGINDPTEVVRALAIIKGEEDSSSEDKLSIETLRKQEWNTLIKGTLNDSPNTGYQATDVTLDKRLQSIFSAIVKVETVPEIKILRGFTRNAKYDRFDIKEEEALLPISSDRRMTWLPGVRNMGEGIFFRFNPVTVSQWRKFAPAYLDEPIQRFHEQREKNELPSKAFDIQHAMIHTFSHALIQEFAAYSGYGTTSLQERLYCDDDMLGVFIYTASGDSEGSLGGLTDLATPDKLYDLIQSALNRIMYCSSDPLCSDGDYTSSAIANGASCHSCTYLSEVSCEWGNVLLDRRLLRSIHPGKKSGFFDDFI